MKVEMALLRHRDALEPIACIASHPAALKQISHWKNQNVDLIEISIPEGTAEAARLLSNGDLALNVAVIGSKNLANLYPNLIVVEEGIQDLMNNYTTFVLLEIVKREHIATKAEVIKELDQFLPMQ